MLLLSWTLTDIITGSGAQAPCFELKQPYPCLVEYVMFLAWKPALLMQGILKKSDEIDYLELLKLLNSLLPQPK